MSLSCVINRPVLAALVPQPKSYGGVLLTGGDIASRGDQHLKYMRMIDMMV